MRITQEADYAVRIVHYLAEVDKKCDAKSIAGQTGTTQRFALKILGKLAQLGFVNSFKGAGGGYMLARDPRDITLLEVITAIDGPIAINKCLLHEDHCPGSGAGCPFHGVFDQISRDIEQSLQSVTFDHFLSAGDGDNS
ncbi:MAG: Rrf2 family transcriptional regulator [Clostridiales bacterium]|nr:Rrf2 family transcriptional regulator [Clostridiales bacterium]